MAKKIERKKLNIILASVFIAVEISLFILFMFFKIKPRILSFSSICVCFAFGTVFLFLNNSNFLIWIALLFTLLSDLQLVLLQTNDKTFAMLTFAIAQLMYFLVIFKRENLKNKIAHICFFFSILLILQVAGICLLKESFSLLVFLSITYFSLLLSSVIFAFVNFNLNKLFACGLLLFVLCDIFVFLGEFNLFFETSISWIKSLNNVPFNFAWFFYLPSQVLLTLCLINLKKNSTYVKIDL